MIRSIVELKNKHPNSDIYIVASGASMQYLDPSFFSNKLSIGVNTVWKRYPVTYLLRKEREGAHEAYNTGIPLIMSEHDCGTYAAERCSIPEGATDPAWMFSHNDNIPFHEVGDRIDPSSDRLIVSSSTITSAIHLAAYMGAKNIIICGHDCGLLDGKSNYDGYYENGLHPNVQEWYNEWLNHVEAESISVCNKLRELYNCNIVSINPFINFGLEGHQYKGHNHGS